MLLSRASYTIGGGVEWASDATCRSRVATPGWVMPIAGSTISHLDRVGRARASGTVVVVGEDSPLIRSVVGTLVDLEGEALSRVELDSDASVARALPHPVSLEAKQHVLRIARLAGVASSLRIVRAATLQGAASQVAAHGGGNVIFVVLDVSRTHPDGRGIEGELERFFRCLAGASIAAEWTPATVVVFTARLPLDGHLFQAPPYTARLVPAEEWALQADILLLLAGALRTAGLSLRRNAQPGPPRVTLGHELVRFLADRAGSRWLFLYYTGSVVSSLIAYVEAVTAAEGVVCARGPSEHSLACGAMANWQLFQRPFLIVVTSAMLDELKGTLANLRDARAQGFIVCAENAPDQWFAFQGTTSVDEDIRAVLAAKRIRTVVLQKPATMREDLAEAFAHYEARRGPVVLLATQQVLESTIPLADRPAYPASHVPQGRSRSAATDRTLDQVVDLLNRQPVRMLWQCGGLAPDEAALVSSIAERAGIALCDSLTRPGTVSRYRGSRRVENYLGTLGLYAYSRAVYAFTHTDGELNPADSQCLFALKSRLPQVATPFSRGTLERKLRLGQVTHTAEHVAPFVTYPVVMELIDFLRHMDARLDVDPGVAALRRQAIARARETAPDPAARIPTVPVTPNYFFGELNDLLEELITAHGYEYVGLFDVGRCGLSAIRNLSRTGPGFSGWYGRALMGDALLASLSVALTSPHPVLGFVGDGARGLVPDVVPFFIECARNVPGRLRQNVTVFILVNGAHSVISTYQEGLSGRWGGRQMRMPSLVPPDWEERHGGLTIRHQRLQVFDRVLLRARLLEPSGITLFSVFMAHNSDGDGLSLLADKVAR